MPVLSVSRPSAFEPLELYVRQLRAAEFLTRQPLLRLPALRWRGTDDGALHGTADDREAFGVWALHLGLVTSRSRRRRGGRVRLRARGQVEGITVTLRAAAGQDRRAA